LSTAVEQQRHRAIVHKRDLHRRSQLRRRIQARVEQMTRRDVCPWLAAGRPFPDWVFSSVTGTALDESNVRKAFNRLLDAAGLRRRGPHQMRHTFASLLLAAGEPITYVSRQLGHRDASITLRVYAHWLPDTSARKGVDRLDDTQPSATPAEPEALTVNERNQLSRLSTVVSRTGIEPARRRAST